MNLGPRLRLVDVLSEWASHNAPWRLGREIVDGLDGVEVALACYSFPISLMIAGQPRDCMRAALSAEDLPELLTFNRLTATELVTALQQDVTRGGEYVRAMAAAPARVIGPLVCACMGGVADDRVRVHAPIVIFDGWHRLAAWILHGQAGQTYPIAVNLVLTARPVPMQKTWGGRLFDE